MILAKDMEAELTDQSYAIGDLVQLKSGSPVMTVVNPDSGGFYWCTWFAGKKNERARFPFAALQKVEAEE